MTTHQTLPLEECIICFYPLANKDIAVLECGHIYHHECIRKWFEQGINKSCPMCNTGKNIIEVIPIKRRRWWCFWF
jgi:hypothetical protein